MERIASFCVDHTRLERGMYLSRQDGDVLTWDIRMKKPNQGDYLTTAAAHTLEHLFATYARNSTCVIFAPPTRGFYLHSADEGWARSALWPILRVPCPVPARWSAAMLGPHGLGHAARAGGSCR